MADAFRTVETPLALADLAANLASEPCVALDTEFVWERTYYARLGMIQIALQDGTCFLVDTVALADLAPLGAVLADPRVEKILHDAPQDLMILRRATGAVARNVFDTRVAAGFAGLSSEISLQNLLADLLGVQLPKGHTRANWMARPLSPGQLEYAADDVRYLPRAAALLRERACASGVELWMSEELRGLNKPATSDERPPGESYLRIRAAASMGPRNLAVLRELAAWREREAVAADLPRRHVADDPELVAVARALPGSAEDLVACRDVMPRTVQRYGRFLLAAVAGGLALPDGDLPPSPRLSEVRPPREQVDAAMETIRRCAAARGVDGRLVGSKNDVMTLLQEGGAALSENHRILRGWRAELLGSNLPLFPAQPEGGR
jgi:ribonuclease D